MQILYKNKIDWKLMLDKILKFIIQRYNLTLIKKSKHFFLNFVSNSTILTQKQIFSTENGILVYMIPK